MRKILAALVLILLAFGILGFASTDKLPGQVLVWVRPEEIVRGQGTPSIVFLVANAAGKPLALNSIDAKKDGLLCASQAVRRSLPVLTAAESKTLMDVISGARLDFPKELASRICIMSVPIAVEHDGLTEKAVKLSADLVFDDGSSKTLEATALLTTTLPAEPGWVAGDGHIHSNYSDGAYDIFQRRNDAVNFGYKWIFMTDHSDKLSSTYADYVYSCGLASTTSIAVGADQEVSAAAGGDYLAYCCNEPLLNKYYNESYLPTYVTNDNPPNSFGGVAHPNNPIYPWTDFPKSVDRGFKFVELFSNERVPDSATIAEWHGQLNYDLPGKIAAGDSGAFTVAVSGSDAHFVAPYWGKNMTYLKTNLTPPTIAPAYQALLAGQAVASGDGSFARFTMGGKQIGQVLRTTASDISISYYIKGASPSTIISWFRLIRVSDGSIVPNSGEVPNTNLYQGTKTVTFAAGDDAYYLEVELLDSSGLTQRVYTNPIFLDR